MLKKIGLGLLVVVFTSALLIGGCRGLEMPDVLQAPGWEWKLSEWLEDNDSFGKGIGTVGGSSDVSIESDGIKIADNPGRNDTGIELTLLTLEVYPAQFYYEIEVTVKGTAGSAPSVQKMPNWVRFTEIPDADAVLDSTEKTLGPAEFGEYAGHAIRIVNNDGAGPALTITEVIIRNIGSKAPVVIDDDDFPPETDLDTAYVVPSGGDANNVFLDLGSISIPEELSAGNPNASTAVSTENDVTVYFAKAQARVAIPLGSAVTDVLNSGTNLSGVGSVRFVIEYELKDSTGADVSKPFQFYIGTDERDNWNASNGVEATLGKGSIMLGKFSANDASRDSTYIVFRPNGDQGKLALKITSIKAVLNHTEQLGLKITNDGESAWVGLDIQYAEDNDGGFQFAVGDTIQVKGIVNYINAGRIILNYEGGPLTDLKNPAKAGDIFDVTATLAAGDIAAIIASGRVRLSGATGASNYSITIHELIITVAEDSKTFTLTSQSGFTVGEDDYTVILDSGEDGAFEDHFQPAGDPTFLVVEE